MTVCVGERERKGEELAEEISQPERASERWEGSSALTLRRGDLGGKAARSSCPELASRPRKESTVARCGRQLPDRPKWDAVMTE